MIKDSLTLEEVELSEDEKHWLITLGFQEYRGLTPFDQASQKYKLFTVDATTGQVRAMKMRLVE